MSLLKKQFWLRKLTFKDGSQRITLEARPVRNSGKWDNSAASEFRRRGKRDDSNSEPSVPLLARPKPTIQQIPTVRSTKHLMLQSPALLQGQLITAKQSSHLFELNHEEN